MSNNCGGVDVKMAGSVLDKKSFKMLLYSFSSKLYWSSYIISIAKTTPIQKVRTLIHSMKFFSVGCSVSL